MPMSSEDYQKTITYGIINEDFISPISYSTQDHYLYYGKDGKKTDRAFITKTYIYSLEKRAWVNSGKQWIWVYGPVKEGEFLMTCSLKGVAIAIDAKEVAFAKALQTKTSRGIDRVIVEFL